MPELAPKAVQQSAHLKALFVPECAKLGEAELACGEGRGNPDLAKSCQSAPAEYRAQCLADADHDKANPLKCRGVMGALDSVGPLWAKGLQQEATPAEAWPKDGVDAFVASCERSAPAERRASAHQDCACISRELQAHVAWKEFAAMAAAANQHREIDPSTQQRVQEASQRCLR